MWLWIAEPTNLVAVFLVRISISLFFLRLIPPKKFYLWIIRVTIAALIVSAVFVSAIYFIQCTPIRKVWEPGTPGRCLGREVFASAVWLYQGEIVLLQRLRGNCQTQLTPLELFRSSLTLFCWSYQSISFGNFKYRYAPN